ncbi:MAG: hypothetical protein H6661_04160 [Ardenticatenaceae bacterium]|nr:hypothetical protein [Ardenticatenaceae bacterium]
MAGVDDKELARLENELMLYGGLLRDVTRAITQLDLHNLDLVMIDLLDLRDLILSKKLDAKAAYDKYQEQKKRAAGRNGGSPTTHD